MRNKGFTLVELMVVVAIIIILAAILIPRYLDVTESAKTAKCSANQKTLEAANGMYMADPLNTDTEEVADLANLAPTYIVQLPTCPKGGTYDIDNGYVTCSYTPTHDRNF